MDPHNQDIQIQRSQRKQQAGGIAFDIEGRNVREDTRHAEDRKANLQRQRSAVFFAAAAADGEDEHQHCADSDRGVDSKQRLSQIIDAQPLQREQQQAKQGERAGIEIQDSASLGPKGFFGPLHQRQDRKHQHHNGNIVNQHRFVPVHERRETHIVQLPDAEHDGEETECREFLARAFLEQAPCRNA